MTKTARLPEEECVYLRSLSGAERSARARALNDAGWSLAAIGDAWQPPKTRSTVKSWLTRLSLSSSSLASSSSSSTLVTAESSHSPTPPAPPPIPSLPPPGEPASASASQHRRNRRIYDPKAPVMSQDEKRKIRELAPVARRYRARANPSGVFARANDDLTAIAVDLYNRGASIRELAVAAGVTYRAMARRVGREDQPGEKHEDNGQ